MASPGCFYLHLSDCSLEGLSFHMFISQMNFLFLCVACSYLLLFSIGWFIIV